MSTATVEPAASVVETRARLSRGASSPAIYRMVERALDERGVSGGLLVDAGCGGGALFHTLAGRFDRYVGADAVRYEGFPEWAELLPVDLDRDLLPMPDGVAEVAAAVETLEHLENPRRLMRELARLTRPGGWVVVTTPNQRSLLSLATLVVKGRFAAFQDVHYPAHLTALLEVDLERMAAECGLDAAAIRFSQEGRIVFSARHYPAPLCHRFPRALSDNLLLIARKPAA